MSSLKTLIIASAVSITAIAGSAHANDQVQFRFNSYELETNNGTKVVYKRMKARALRACDGGNSKLSKARSVNACADNLLNEWVESVGNVRLEQLHATQNKSYKISFRN